VIEESGSPSSGPSKRNVLNLDLLLGPKATVQTSVGTVYLYSLRTSDISEFGKLKAYDLAERVREFLPHIASLSETSSFKEEREPLPLELAAQLTEADLDALATAYASPTVLWAVRVDSTKEGGVPPRQESETAVAYLDRLLKQEIKTHTDDLRKMREKILASGSSIFDQVRKSSSDLGSTLTEFEQLAKRSAPVEIRAPNMDHFHAMNEQFARQARERAEELEMVRLTGKMTADSAKTLKDLAEAATVLLEQLDERDKKADKSTRTQISIAVWSVGVAAVLALFALIVSGFSYFQDKTNNESGDKWQSELTAVMREGNQQRSTAEKEAQRLRVEVDALEAKIGRIESAQATVLPSNSAASAARRAVSPGSTLPPP